MVWDFPKLYINRLFNSDNLHPVLSSVKSICPLIETCFRGLLLAETRKPSLFLKSLDSSLIKSFCCFVSYLSKLSYGGLQNNITAVFVHGKVKLC